MHGWGQNHYKNTNKILWQNGNRSRSSFTQYICFFSAAGVSIIRKLSSSLASYNKSMGNGCQMTCYH